MNIFSSFLKALSSFDLRSRFTIFIPLFHFAVCKQKFYNFTRYMTHVRGHSEFPSSKCIKCGEAITQETIIKHLCLCHGFGTYQCCYCRFGCDKFETYLVHLADRHSSEIPMFFDRLNRNSTGSIKLVPIVSSNASDTASHEIIFFHSQQSDNAAPPPIDLKQITLHLSRQSCLKDGLMPIYLRNEVNVQRLSKNYVIKNIYEAK